VRPRPTREWVMEELEKQGVRVVNGRLGRKEGDDAGSSDHGAYGAPGETRVNGIGLHLEPNSAGILNPVVRRNSSIGLSLLSDVSRNPLGALEQFAAKGSEPAGIQTPPHRPYRGGSAAAAYEAAFFDHCLRKSEEQQRRASGVGIGTLPGPVGGLAAATNPNQ
jgi:hypothetical protein